MYIIGCIFIFKCYPRARTSNVSVHVGIPRYFSINSFYPPPPRVGIVVTRGVRLSVYVLFPQYNSRRYYGINSKHDMWPALYKRKNLAYFGSCRSRSKVTITKNKNFVSAA